ncbi:hypothetical protein NFI96_013690, partial [Prochilodus magdalenae]
FKTLMLAYKAKNGPVPPNLTAMVKSRAVPRALRASSTARLEPPSLRTHGRQASRLFSVLAPRWWNELPLGVRTAESLAVFKRRLKTHLFVKHLSTSTDPLFGQCLSLWTDLCEFMHINVAMASIWRQHFTMLILCLFLFSDELNRSVIANVTVNEQYINEFDDTSSKESKEFAADFKTKMTLFYTKKIKHFLDITNIILSKGGPLDQRRHRRWTERETSVNNSVKVQHDIIVKIPNDQADVVYDEIFKQVEEALTTVQNCSVGDVGNCPNFIITEAGVSRTELNGTEICEQATAELPEDYRQYYTNVTVDRKVTCVTACHREHSDPKLCENRGTCAVSKNGPACYCRHTDANWYLGEDCTLKVSKVGLYAGLGVVLVVLVLAIAVLSVYLFINRSRTKRDKDNKQQLVNQWLDDDFEWSPSRPSTSHSGLKMNYDNLGYAHENRYSQLSNSTQRPHYSTQPSASPQQHIPPGYYHNNQPVKCDKNVKINVLRIDLVCGLHSSAAPGQPTTSHITCWNATLYILEIRLQYNALPELVILIC